MKYFVKNWAKNDKQAEKVIKEYQEHYKTIENKLSDDVKRVIHNRHDTHIVKSYFSEKDYIMELDEEVWGKTKFIFKNAEVKRNSDIKDEYWLDNEIYKVLDKTEIHIQFNKSDTIIVCDDAYISIENKEYFKELYKKENYNIDIFDTNKTNIINEVRNKKFICGRDMLEPWEQLIYSFSEIYRHINYYKYNNIENILKYQYEKYSIEEQKEIYIKLFKQMEKDLINNINIIKKYKETIKEEDLNYIINRLLGIYNKKDVPIQNKNQLYMNFNEELKIDLNKIYKKLLEYIEEGFIK